MHRRSLHSRCPDTTVVENNEEGTFQYVFIVCGPTSNNATDDVIGYGWEAGVGWRLGLAKPEVARLMTSQTLTLTLTDRLLEGTKRPRVM